MNPHPVTQLGSRRVFDTKAFNDAAILAQNAANLRGGPGILVSKASGQTTISRDRRRSQIHPWFTSVEWRADKEEWWVRVVPGFVNGRPINVPALEYSYYETEKEESKKTVIPTLLEDWACPIPKHAYRSIRGRELDGEAVPRYFQEFMGVKEEKSGVGQGGPGGMTMNISEQEDQGTRKLKAVDVVLTAYRPTYKVGVDFPGNLVLGQIVDYSVAMDVTNAFKPPDIRVMQRIPKGGDENDFLQRLMGNYGDEGIDQILVSTIFFVSPPEEVAQKPLDQVSDEWTPVPKHNLFWNVGYWSEVEQPKNFSQVGDTGLYAFLGRYTVAPQAALGAMEAMFQAILNAAFNQPPRGTFYTA